MKLIRLALSAVLASVALQCVAQQALDRASRSLQILVRFDDSGDFARQAIGASGSIGNRGSDVEVRAQDSRASRDERVDQRIRVLEGSRAYISTGQSRPVMQRRAIQTPVGPVGQDTFEVQDAVTGFEVVPRVSGNRVFVDIAPQRQSFDSRGGVHEQRLTTSASGRLGEWFELGAIAGSGARDDRGLASASRSGSSQTRRIWVKVEETGN